ncbi:MAG TPA: hypothetical protein PKC87_05710, partial [Candidatus Absconditabacterales bacterium]|nr:hypothetical protein [Candidatus Absconditabacterales bacterium]
DSGGNTVSIVGFTRSNPTYFGSYSITGASSNKLFIAKASSGGQWLEAKQADGTSVLRGGSISIDTQGNRYVIGELRGTGTFGTITIASSTNGTIRDHFVAKMSNTGTWLRAKAISGGLAGLPYRNNIDIDPVGDVYIIGEFLGTQQIGPNLFNAGATTDIFIGKLSTAGSWIWSQQISGTVTVSAGAIKYTNDGGIYVAGSNLASTTAAHIIQKRNGSGEYFGEKEFTFGNIRGISLLEDDIYAIGSTNQSVTVDSVTITASSSQGNAWVGKLQGTGSASGSLFTINNDALTTSTTSVTLNINCPIDAGVGGEVIIYDNSSPNINGTRTGCTATKPWTLTAGEGLRIVYMKTKDALGNISEEYSDNIFLDGGTPTVGTGYISVGMTGNNGTPKYYKGTITISGAVSDTVGLNTGTCMYTLNGSTWSAANYSGTSTTGYCYIGGLTPGVDINIRFRIQDAVGNMGTGGIGTYIYDGVGPNASSIDLPYPGDGFATGTIDFSWSAVTDNPGGGIGVSGYYYVVSTGVSYSPVYKSGFIQTNSITLTGFVDAVADPYNWKVYAIDKFGNTG